MRRIFIFLIVIAGLTLLATPVSIQNIDKKIWTRIDSLEAQGLYRSALNLVDQIYSQSRNQADPQTEIKALLYKLKYIQQLEEDGQLAAIGFLQKELPDQRLVQGSLKYSIMAELYSRYYSANRWQISQNPMVDNGSDQSVKKWSPERFYQVILESYNQSLKNSEQSASVRVSSIPEIWAGNLADTLYNPVLRDVLISRLLDFLDNSGDFTLPDLKPVEFCSAEIFSDPSRFSSMGRKIAADVKNPFSLALKWYGKWVSESTDKSLLAADLRRLRYMHEKSCNQSRDSLYEAGLLRWAVKMGKDSAEAIVYEALANYHLDRSNLFQINDPDTFKYDNERKQAARWLIKTQSWPETLAGKRCQNLLNVLMKPELSVQSETYQVPMSLFPVSIEYRNIKNLNYKIIRTSAIAYYSDWENLDPSEKSARIISSKIYASGKIALPEDEKLNPHRANALINPLPAGFYLLVFSSPDNLPASDKIMVTVPVSISSTTLVSRQGNSGKRTFYFRDRDNGSPLSGISVVPWYSLYDQDSRHTILEKGSRKISGEQGFLELSDGGPGRDDPSPKAYRLQIINKNDTLITHELFYPGYSQGKISTRTNLVLYTDRSIYKPGDEVFFRGLLIDYTGDSMSIHHADSLILKLQDPRYQVVGEMSFEVDSLGVFSGALKLPYKGLTGNYLIQSKFGQALIRMEQYRRPAFAIKINRDAKIFQPGDTVSVSGKLTALSGEPVAGAEISADIDIQPVNGPGRWVPFNGQKIRITTCRAVSDAKGIFTCRWASIPAESSPFGNGSMIRYSINLKATDQNGETHQEETRIDCGIGSVGLMLRLNEKMLTVDSLRTAIGAIGTDDRVISLPVKLVISKLKDPSQIWTEPFLPEPDRFIVTPSDWKKMKMPLPFKNEYLPSAWSVTNVVYNKTFVNDTITPVVIPPAGKWQEGWYKIELVPANPAICKSVIRYVLIEEPDPVKIVSYNQLFARVSEKSLNPGQILQLNFASTQRSNLLVELQNSKGEVFSDWYAADKNIQKRVWKVTNDWQGGALLHLIIVASNRVIVEDFPITVPWQISQLTISGFQNLKKVKPGDDIKIDLMVKDQQGNPVVASVALTVYDASLDLINPHSWLQVTRPSFFGGPCFQGLNSGANGSVTIIEPFVNIVDVPFIEPINLNWFGLGFYGISRMDAPVMKMAMAQPEGRKGGDNGEGVKEVIDIKDVKEDEGESTEIVFRNDFRETAFFKGDILTDKNGLAEVTFKMPEVFTEWKVLVTCHNRNLAFGSLEHRFKTVKDLMIRSNFPEFMRNGDTVDLAARVGWYGQGRISAVTSLNLTDTSGFLLKSYPDFKSSLTSGTTAPFTWQYTPTKNDPVLYNLSTISPAQSDGLKDTISVLPDNVELWNAQPFFFAKPGKKQLKIDGNPLEAVYEVTTTPAWQILQSLPVVTGQEQDCSAYWFSRLYLACLTGSIADKFPGVAEKFLSDSVPEKQKDRIKQIREWMNPDTRRQEMAYVLEKLSSLQNQDGTWPWYKGMGIDVFMTQQIIAGFGEMKARGVFDITAIQRGNFMLTHAIEAMDNWMYMQFLEISRLDSVHPQKVQLNPLVIHYLYARSFFPGLSLQPSHEVAWMRFNERIPLEWTQHEMGLQALMAITSVQLGRKANALPILNSLRERAKFDDQWGMYWPRKGFESSWFNWDLWMQSRMIELFACIEEGRKDLDQMKIYLIHQKRGRDWGNSLVAAWAAKSMLFYGTSQSIEPAAVAMKWGSEEYSPLRIKTGSTGVTGYYRFEWKNQKEIPVSKTMEVTQTSGGHSWGTLYTLKNYKLDQLSSTTGPLNVSREVMTYDEKGTWKVIKQGQWINVGDKIRIRLNIKSDRELSYIEIKDYLGTGVLPVRVLSGYQYRQGISYYQSREPESVFFYLSALPKGESTMEYQAIVEQAGSYFGGYATATSLYAPEFRAWSNSSRIHAKR